MAFLGDFHGIEIIERQWSFVIRHLLFFRWGRFLLFGWVLRLCLGSLGLVFLLFGVGGGGCSRGGGWRLGL